VDVKFEQVEELVGDKVDGAVYVFFEAEVEFEGAPGFVAGGEGYVLEMACCVGDVFASLSACALANWLGRRE
jgi:hypothetical protein